MKILPNHKCVKGQKVLERVTVEHCDWGATEVPAPGDPRPQVVQAAAAPGHQHAMVHRDASQVVCWSRWFGSSMLLQEKWCTKLLDFFVIVYLLGLVSTLRDSGGCWEGGGESRGALQCISVRLSVVPLNLCQAMVVLLITSQKNKVLGIQVKRFCHQDTLWSFAILFLKAMFSSFIYWKI